MGIGSIGGVNDAFGILSTLQHYFMPFHRALASAVQSHHHSLRGDGRVLLYILLAKSYTGKGNIPCLRWSWLSNVYCIHMLLLSVSQILLQIILSVLLLTYNFTNFLTLKNVHLPSLLDIVQSLEQLSHMSLRSGSPRDMVVGLQYSHMVWKSKQLLTPS